MMCWLEIAYYRKCLDFIDDFGNGIVEYDLIFRCNGSEILWMFLAIGYIEFNVIWCEFGRMQCL